MRGPCALLHRPNFLTRARTCCAGRSAVVVVAAVVAAAAERDVSGY